VGFVEAKTSPRGKTLGKHWKRLLCFDCTYHLSNMPFGLQNFFNILNDMYLDYSNLLPQDNGKFNDVAKMLNVSPAECEKNFRKFCVYRRFSQIPLP
jgi:hypothetical protein